MFFFIGTYYTYIYTCWSFCTFPTCNHILMALSIDPGTAGLGLNLAAEGKFKAGDAASILGTTSAVLIVATATLNFLFWGNFTTKKFSRNFFVSPCGADSHSSAIDWWLRPEHGKSVHTGLEMAKNMCYYARVLTYAHFK